MSAADCRDEIADDGDWKMQSDASSPACHAIRAGSGAPLVTASAFAGSITRNTWAKSETVLMP